MQDNPAYSHVICIPGQVVQETSAQAGPGPTSEEAQALEGKRSSKATCQIGGRAINMNEFICKIVGHRDRDDFDIDREPMFMWKCTRCGRHEKMQFTCLIVRPISEGKP